MLEYFPTNYVWNLSTNIALLMGGNIGEVDIICRKLGAAAKIGDDSGTVAFFGYTNDAAEPQSLHFTRLTRQADQFFVKLSYLFRL